jgi:hypothetical protein
MNGARLELAAAATLGAVLVVLGVSFGAPKRTDDPSASTFNDSRDGLRALHLVLDDVGATPRRLTRAPAADDPTDRTLVVAAPTETITKRETSQLVDWVDAGGRLVIVVGGPEAGANHPKFLAAFDVLENPFAPAARDPLKIEDAGLAEGIGKIDWTVSRSIAAQEGVEQLVTKGEHCLVGRMTRGEEGGEVVVVADCGFLSNESLGKLDNAVLAVRLLLGRASDEGRVVFDEFHHGRRDDGASGDVGAALAAMLVDTWPGRALCVLVLAGALAIAGASVRLGAPERERPPPRRALSEHAEALGRLFETSRARAVSLRILAAGARRAAGPRAGILASLPAAEFARRLRASPAPGASDLADALREADAARAAKDVAMARIAANLAAAKRRFLHGRP